MDVCHYIVLRKGIHIRGKWDFHSAKHIKQRAKFRAGLMVVSEWNNHEMLVSWFHDMRSWYHDMSVLVSELASSDDPYFLKLLYLLRQYIY